MHLAVVFPPWCSEQNHIPTNLLISTFHRYICTWYLLIWKHNAGNNVATLHLPLPPLKRNYYIPLCTIDILKNQYGLKSPISRVLMNNIIKMVSNWSKMWLCFMICSCSPKFSSVLISIISKQHEDYKTVQTKHSALCFSIRYICTM